MNAAEIATIVYAMRELQRVCPVDTYDRQVAQQLADATLSLVSPTVNDLVVELERAQ